MYTISFYKDVYSIRTNKTGIGTIILLDLTDNKIDSWHMKRCNYVFLRLLTSHDKCI